MFERKKSVPAAQIAEDHARSVNQLLDHFQKRIGALSSEEASSPLTDRRKEVCAMIWAASVATLEFSSLEKIDKDKLVPLVLQQLLPTWEKYFDKPSEMPSFISGRTSAYLSEGDPDNPIETARGLADEMLSAIGASKTTTTMLLLTWVPLLMEIIVSDASFFNSVKSEFGIA